MIAHDFQAGGNCVFHGIQGAKERVVILGLLKFEAVRGSYGFLNPMPEPQMLTRIIPHSPPAPADDDDAPMGAGTRHHWPRGEMTPEEIAEALQRATQSYGQPDFLPIANPTNPETKVLTIAPRIGQATFLSSGTPV